MLSIEARLERLERVNRRWRRLCGLLLLGVGFLVLSAQSQIAREAGVKELLEKAFVAEEVVTANQFRLVDSEGNVRAVIGVKDSGDAGVYIFNEAGAPLARLSGRESLSDLHLTGAGGNVISLNFTENTPHLVMSRRHSRGSKIELLAEDPIPRFRLIDRLNRTLHEAPEIP